MKSISIFLFSFFLLTGIDLIAQTRQYETNPDKKRANIWYFGQNAGIDFNTNPPTPLMDGKINTWEGCSSICDTSGKLLFYTDGRSVWDNNHQVMANGTGLNGDISSTQSALIIHHPENDSIYFIITTPYAYDYNVGAKYSIVNLYQNKIVAKNLVLHPNSSEKITAVYHGNGKDIWVVGHEYGNNKFFSYLLTNTGIINCGIISSVGTNLSNDEFNNQGQIKFSVDGKLLAICHYTSMLVGLCSFDNINGYLTYKKSIYTNAFSSGILPYSIEFSYNNKFLYIFLRDNYILQYNIINSNLISLMKLNAGRWGQCTKSPNGKTYFHYRDSTFLNSLIDENDSNVALEFNSISISPQKTLASLPNFNQSYFNTPSVDFAFNYNCTTNIISFEGRDTFYADSFNWRIQKVFGFSLYSSKYKNPKITFTDTGMYDVAFIATKGSRSDTVSKRITIYPKIDKDFLGRDSMYKSNTLFNLVLKTPLNMHCISWHDSSSSPAFTANTTGVFSVTITNKAFCIINDTITITRCENSLPKPILMRDKDTLKTLSSIADSFVWYRNGNMISTTRDTFIVLNDTGTYMVSASKQGFCNNMSDVFNYPCLIGLTVPIIYLKTDTIFATHGEADSFVWYRNNIKYTSTIDSFLLLSDTGTFEVDAYRDKFCHSTSKPLYVHCLDRLAIPVIYLSRDTLYATVSLADSFLWYRNGKNIKSTKEAFIKISDTGTYYVEATKALNCNRRSSFLLVSEINTSLQSIIQKNIKIFPNPADETISIEIDEFVEFDIRLYDIEGRLQYEGNTSGAMTILNIEEFKQGLYLIELSNNQTLHYYKILIQ
ncbi:MAG: hypothetical protein RLZZ60_457 [Bacteroidota bacterium]|jgi:hypothetical protein